jgi:serine phosphatase RsbU (regulator of sigma subunit)
MEEKKKLDIAGCGPQYGVADMPEPPRDLTPRKLFAILGPAVIALGGTIGGGAAGRRRRACSALVTAACRAYVRAAWGDEQASSAVMRRVNSLLHADLGEERFVTLVLVDLDAETHEVLLLSAGHGPTLHVRGEDGEVRQIGSQAMPLGLVDRVDFDETVRVRLDPDDLIVLCSDGFFEAANVSEEAFGLERLADVLGTHRHKSAAQLLATMENAVRAFVGNLPQPDDMTAVIIKRLR